MATTAFAPQPQNIYSPPHYGQPTYQQNSTPPSNNVSPTSQTSYLHARQMRQPKQPLYIPAVYRPTEVSASRQSLTPPRSANNSVDSNSAVPIKFTLPNSPPISPDEENEASFAPWGQASISRVVTDEWNDEALGAVTGAPTRNHWKVCFVSPLPIARVSSLSHGASRHQAGSKSSTMSASTSVLYKKRKLGPSRYFSLLLPGNARARHQGASATTKHANTISIT